MSKVFTQLVATTLLTLVVSLQTIKAEGQNYNDMVMNHIGNANEFHIVGDLHLPLPCILYSKDQGLSVFMSSAFEHGSKAVDGYVLDHGVVRRIKGFPSGKGTVVALQDTEADGHGEGGDAHGAAAEAGGGHGGTYIGSKKEKGADGKETQVSFVKYGDQTYPIEKASTLLSMTSWIDLSVSKNVFSMLLAVVLLFLVFNTVSKSYKRRAGQAPKGLQSFFEPIIVFIRDEVARPTLGDHKYERFFPYILAIFFFILFNNLIGLVPFFPFSANVTGNIGVTLTLAVFTFLITNLNGNGHYWQHVFWMPGVPAPIKPILSILEFIGLFTKPFTLMIRLFANITGGHIIILSLVGLIWILGNNGQSIGGAVGGSVIAVLFVFVMNLLELFVAFLQAFIFALLSCLYIADAIAEHHHKEHDEAHGGEHVAIAHH